MTNRSINIALFFVISLIIVYWVTFINKIGLHGDEAWFGLEGVNILKNGLVKPIGMNNYSGVIQSYLDSLMFNIAGVGVVQLRITGIVCNILSLLLIIYFFYNRVNKLSALYLSMLIGQSVFYLTFAKISWEVLSFNFLLTSLLIVSLYFFAIKDKREYLYGGLFLTVNFIGTYNHIIFSGIVFSGFVGFAIWILFSKIEFKLWIVKVYTLLFIGLINSFIVYKTMNSFILTLWDLYGNYLFLFPFIIIIFELLIIKKIFLLVKCLLIKFIYVKSFIKFNVFIYIRFITVLILAFWFIKFHLKTLFQVFSQEIIFERIFSYEVSNYVNYFFVLVSLSVLLLTFYFIIRDLISETKTPLTIILVVYMGILHFYTSGFSIRYFWTITILIYLYLSVNIVSINVRIQRIFMVLLFINMFFSFLILWSININTERKVKAINFSINGNVETSAHFLNFEPVLDYVHKNEIGYIETPQYFFIGNVFNFYTKTDTVFLKYKNSMKIDYDYKTLDNGFVIEKK